MDYERLMWKLRCNVERYDKMGKIDKIHALMDKVKPLAEKQRINSTSYQEMKRRHDEHLLFRTA